MLHHFRSRRWIELRRKVHASITVPKSSSYPMRVDESLGRSGRDGEEISPKVLQGFVPRSFNLRSVISPPYHDSFHILHKLKLTQRE
jgi:hypothetical protein